MGRIAKGAKCSVSGCEKQAIRSISTESVVSAGLKVGDVKRSYLCKDHYKELKRQTKNETMLERWRYKG